MPEDTSNLQNLLLMTLKLRKFEESRRWYLQLVKLINREAIFKFLSNTASNDSQVEEFKLYIAKR